MDIVAAGVHHRDIVTVAIGSTRCAGIRQSGLFFDRQSIHVGTQQRSIAATVVQHPDHACSADAFFDLITKLIELLRNDARRTGLLQGQFGMGMQIAIDFRKIN